MRIEKRGIFNNINYVCDVFADSKNDVLIIDKVDGTFDLNLRTREDISRDIIMLTLREINESPYYTVNLYSKNAINKEIDEAIEYLENKLEKLKLVKEMNNIINKDTDSDDDDYYIEEDNKEDDSSVR